MFIDCYLDKCDENAFVYDQQKIQISFNLFLMFMSRTLLI